MGGEIHDHVMAGDRTAHRARFEEVEGHRGCTVPFELCVRATPPRNGCHVVAGLAK